MDINDAEKIVSWLNDLNVTINLNLYGKNISTDDEMEILKNISKEHYYSIIDKKADDLIGCCSFKNIDQLNQTAEVGIYIGNRNYWNKGYGSEALTILLDYGFKALNLNNVFLTVFDYNKSAKKCYEKVGFKEIGTRREGLRRNLKKYDIIYMDILCDEFYKNNKIIKEIK
jgi:RimJ/RimL family protein N-acetyltransferase